MKKRAVDLSLQELAAMGANAALLAANRTRDAGLVVTGTVDRLEDGQLRSHFAQRLPSGSVVLLAAAPVEGGEADQTPELLPPVAGRS